MSKFKGFTLIELMVVIGIIAILSTLIVVYFNTAKMTARDARRLSDVKQIQLALKMFYNDVGIYPTTVTIGASIANGGTNYLLRVPSNPTPRNDTDCVDQDYQYAQLESGERYSLAFCLGDQTDDITAGNHTATANGILNCDTGYIAIPGSSTFNTNDFCVMKYEAKCATTAAPTVGLTTPVTAETTYDNATTACTTTRAPVSVSSGYPIGNISRTTAVTYCQNIGGHLMTNPEWMTIAKNIEQVASNWNDGAGPVGTAYINIGNHAVTDAMDGTAAYGSGGATWYYKRAHTLSSGDTINDIGGNVSEALNSICTSGTGSGNYETAASYTEWSSTSSPDLSDYEKGAAGPSAAYISTQAVGKYKGCSSTGNAFSRGAKASDILADSGVFQVDLSIFPTSTATLLGFRCVE